MERNSLLANKTDTFTIFGKKTYVHPHIRIIDLMEEDGILNNSDENANCFDIGNDYAEEDAFSQKKSIWKTEDWLSK